VARINDPPDPLLLSLGVVGLAAQWVQGRGWEVRLLWTRGVSPVAIGSPDFCPGPVTG
jgi:hypothetical protein